MTQTRKKILIIALAALAFLCAAFMLFKNNVYADTNSDLECTEKVSQISLSIRDGASVSSSSPYVLKWETTESIYTATREAKTAFLNAYNTTASHYFDLTINYSYFYKTTWLLFKASDLGGIDATGSNVSVHYHNDGIYQPAATTDGIYVTIGTSNVPIYPVYVDSSCGSTLVYKCGAANTSTQYVPILSYYNRYWTSGIFGISYTAYDSGKTFYNANSARSCAYVSQRALVAEADTLTEGQKYILNTNCNINYTKVEELTTNAEFETLNETYPLNLTMSSGATFSGSNITWNCTFSINNFTEWSAASSSIYLNWVVLKHSDLATTGTAIERLNADISNSVFSQIESPYTINNGMYNSSISYSVSEEDSDEYFIAYAYITATGIWTTATVTDSSIGLDDTYLSGTYVLATLNDNARVLDFFTEEGEYTYVFNWLEDIAGTPFAELKTKTLILNNRIDAGSATVITIANIVGAPIDEETGKMFCLMSECIGWDSTQLQDGVSYIYNAVYSLIPLTIVSDRTNTPTSINLGLLPFTSITAGQTTYAKNITSLRDSSGTPYFNTLNAITASELYGYFYVYSYESELSDPAWQINQDDYDGAIVYFTETESQISTSAATESDILLLCGVNAGIGLVIGASVGGFIGAFIGGFIGGAVGLVASLFVTHEDTVYYHTEYGFLDCTNMLPSISLTTLAEDELSDGQKVLFALLIVAEIVLMAFVVHRSSALPGWFKIVIVLAFIVGCIVLDIYLYNYLLTL